MGHPWHAIVADELCKSDFALLHVHMDFVACAYTCKVALALVELVLYATKRLCCFH